MLAIVRQNTIRERLLAQKSVAISDLAESLHVTKETIRRDLRVMESRGELIRTHGGAHLPDTPSDLGLGPHRRDVNAQAKEVIAQKCDSLILPGDTIFLDASTTCWYIAQRISRRNLTVLTPSLQIAGLLAASPSISLVLIGGTFSRNTTSCVGTGACQALEQYFVDKAFISPRFVSLEHGLTDPTEPEARLRKVAISHSRSVYLTVDHTKLDKTSFALIAPLSEITALITDAVLSPAWQGKLSALGKRYY